MRMAFTRDVSPAIVRCELTHLAREPIDVETARRQHGAYEQALKQAGCSVVRLAAGDQMPDSVFIEDIAVVFDEIAVITHPGAESRRGETTAVVEALAPYRPLVHIEPPGTVDGGDVLIVGKRVFVGDSRRTNGAAISQMARHLAPFGYTVHLVPVHGCLHLKSAATAVADDTLLVNPDWVEVDRFRPLHVLAVHPAEPSAGNALRIDGEVIYPTAFPRTSARLADRGIGIVEVDVSELAKAEGAVTCCSLVFNG